MVVILLDLPPTRRRLGKGETTRSTLKRRTALVLLHGDPRTGADFAYVYNEKEVEYYESLGLGLLRDKKVKVR